MVSQIISQPVSDEMLWYVSPLNKQTNKKDPVLVSQ
jgi:hypothetical protein